MIETHYSLWVVYGYVIWVVIEYAWDWWKHRAAVAARAHGTRRSLVAP